MLSVGYTQGASSGESHNRAAAAGSCAPKPLFSNWHWGRMSLGFFHLKEWQISLCYWCNLSSMFSWMRVPMKNVYLQATGLEALDVLINFEGLLSEQFTQLFPSLLWTSLDSEHIHPNAFGTHEWVGITNVHRMNVSITPSSLSSPFYSLLAKWQCGCNEYWLCRMAGVIGKVLHERGRLWLPYIIAAGSLWVQCYLHFYIKKKKRRKMLLESNLPWEHVFLALWA